MSRLTDNEDNIRTIDINDNESDVPLSLTIANNQRSFSECCEREQQKISPKEEVRLLPAKTLLLEIQSEWF